ncbi:unnamed protein product [Rhizopus stolonifer]
MTKTQQSEKNIENKLKKHQESLPVPIHLDDAKDKVFTAILKALFRMENKPSSPKELANIIVKHKYATLGGATPFATVSSRISQHFKKAAEHNPPRAPLLAKHVDQNHSRKINYSLAIDSVSSATEEEETHELVGRTARKPSRSSNESHVLKKRKVDSSLDRRRKSSACTLPGFTETASDVENDSISEHADYHEEMLKDSEKELDISAIKRPKSSKDVKPPFLGSLQEETTAKKPSFSFNSGFPGEHEFWMPFSFEHDFENVLIHDPSTVHHIPFNIVTPESISVSELDDYFASSSSSATSRSHRKSFPSATIHPNDKSLLQKVLLTSVTREVAERIDKEKEVIQEEIPKIIIKKAQLEPEQASGKLTSQKSAKLINSSCLMDVENSEDFIKFEEDEKSEAPPPPAVIALPTPILPVPIKKDLLPANDSASSAAALSVLEWLKFMNIQNINLPTLQQMASNLQTLQQTSPTFDLAKTMAGYIQPLTKSANNNDNPSSSSPTTASVDIKSILARFPLMETFLRKDNTAKPTTPSHSPSPTETRLFNTNGTEPIVNTLTPMKPPMFITVIDQIAVCVTVLEKTETTHRIMRRLDTCFVNGTSLLEAGGIETESERSMILSFEMNRVRMTKVKSPLFGTWIPLRRAQELAITCSVQHKLSHFLDDSIEPYFPLPLPIQMSSRKGDLKAALRFEKISGLQELWMTLKPRRSSKNRKNDEASDEGSLHEDTKVKQNILAESTLQELFSRATPTYSTHIHPKDLQKKRGCSLSETTEDIKEEETKEEKTKKHTRKKSERRYSIGNTESDDKLATYGIKKSISTGGSAIRRASTGGKRVQQQRKIKAEKEVVKNTVVEHKSSIILSVNNQENEEDEEIDIGGSDFDDDLR